MYVIDEIGIKRKKSMNEMKVYLHFQNKRGWKKRIKLF